MRLIITFRAFALIQILSVLVTLAAPEAKMESFGLSYSNDTLLFMQFSAISQLMLALVTFTLPSWLGTNLWKAAPTYLRLVKFTATFCKHVPHYFWYYDYHRCFLH